MRQTHIKRFGPTTKVGQVCSSIRQMALKHGPGVKLPTARELCSSLDISQVTLNEALNTLESQNVIIRKDRSGIFVSEKIGTKSIRILMDTSLVQSAGHSPFWGIMWGLIAQEAQERVKYKNEDIRFEMVSVGLYKDIPLPDETLELIDAGMVHGVLSFGINPNSADSVVYQNLPLVSFAGAGHWLVNLDHDAMMPLVVPELAALGCRKIAFWTQPLNPLEDLSDLYRDQKQAFAAALANSGLPFHEELASPYESGAPWHGTFQQFGYKLVMDAFGGEAAPRPDGIFITDDMVTAGAIVAFNKLGIRIGTDVQIGTHANKGSSVLFGYEDVLTRAEFDALTIVRTMFDKLDDLIAGRVPDPQITPVKPVLTKPG